VLLPSWTSVASGADQLLKVVELLFAHMGRKRMIDRRNERHLQAAAVEPTFMSRVASLAEETERVSKSHWSLTSQPERTLQGSGYKNSEKTAL
jgi:hypothetical protein